MFEKINAIPPIIVAVIKSGRIKRDKEIPADFMATNSKVSPRFPNVIIDDNNIANGRAKGISVAETYIINFKMIIKSKPLPTKSSIYNQKNCITNTNNDIKKVAKKGPIKDLRINVSNFFITLLILYKTYCIIINRRQM